MAIALRLFVATLLWIYLHIVCRVEYRGRLPLRQGATLVISNHLHDLDGMVAPILLTFTGPWRRPVYCAASQRLFEPGFLATRFPGIFRPFLYRRNAAGLFTVLGVLPIENQPLMRPLSSFAHFVLQAAGDLPVKDVFTPETLQKFSLPPAAPLSVLWDRRYAAAMLVRRVSLTALQEPYRTMVRSAQRARIEGQMQVLKERLREGATLYLTPEGRYSPNGRVQRLRLALQELLPLADRVYGIAINYDPFLRRHLSLYVRIGPFAPDGNDSGWLARQRTITVSQVVAAAVLSLPRAFTEQDVRDRVRRQIEAFPPSAPVASELAQDGVAVTRCLRGMVKRGVVLPVANSSRGELTLAGERKRALAIFPDVSDILVFLQQSLDETLEACRGALVPTSSSIPLPVREHALRSSEQMVDPVNPVNPVKSKA